MSFKSALAIKDSLELESQSAVPDILLNLSDTVPKMSEHIRQEAIQFLDALKKENFDKHNQVTGQEQVRLSPSAWLQSVGPNTNKTNRNVKEKIQ